MAVEQELIRRGDLKIKLQQHHDFFVNAWGGFSNLPVKDKARVDEITQCIAEVVNARAIPAVLVKDVEAAKKKLLTDMNELYIDYRRQVTASTDYAAGHADAMGLAKRMVYDVLTQLCICSDELGDLSSTDSVSEGRYNEVVQKLESLLCHATGGIYSKSTYSEEKMLQLVTSYIERRCDEAVEEQIVYCKNCQFSKLYDNGCRHCRSQQGLYREVKDEEFCSYGERMLDE